MCYQVYTTFLPLYLADELGLDAKGIGLYIALLFSVSIVASPAMGYLSDRLNRKVILVPMLIGSSLFAVLLALYGRGVSLAILLGLLGLFLRSDYSLLSAMALDIVGGNVATTTLGVLSFTRFALGAISPLVAGLLYERHGMGAAFYFVAALFGLAALILATTRLESRSAQGVVGS
jgi:MFS family permease